MRTLNNAAATAIADDEIVKAGAARFSIGAGYRFWSGVGDLTINGETYLGINDKAAIAPVSSSTGGAASGVKLTLSGLEPDVAASIEAENYSNKPVILYRLIFDRAGVNLLDCAVVLRGRLNRVPQREIVNGPCALDFEIENSARDLERGGSQRRSDVHQRILGGASDNSLSSVSVAPRKRGYWGKRPSDQPVRPGYVHNPWGYVPGTYYGPRYF